jgi:hypothetical protein
MRIVLALLVGFICGAGATVYLLQSGAADLFIRKTEVVAELERKLLDAEKQRTDLVERAGRMEASFLDLERRFRDLHAEMGRERRPAEEAPAANP